MKIIKINKVKVSGEKIKIKYSVKIGSIMLTETAEIPLLTLLSAFGYVPEAERGEELFYTGWVKVREFPDVPKKPVKVSKRRSA